MSDDHEEFMLLATRLIDCTRLWDPAARLLGNLTAAEIGRVALSVIALRATIARLTKERDEARADAVLALALDQEQIDALSAERDGLLRTIQRESARVNEMGGVQAHLVGVLHEISRCTSLDNAKTFAVTALANVEENRAGLWQPGPSDDAADWKPGHHRERTDAESIERETAERIAEWMRSIDAADSWLTDRAYDDDQYEAWLADQIRTLAWKEPKP